MSAKKLVDKRLQKEFLREIDEHKESLNKEMKAYFEEIEDQEKRNPNLIRENHLIHGFQELSIILVDTMVLKTIRIQFNLLMKRFLI